MRQSENVHGKRRKSYNAQQQTEHALAADQLFGILIAMMLLSLFAWWYGAGWARMAQRTGGRVDAVLEAFSVPLLARTLFAPFRQISAVATQGPLPVRVRALGDRLFSRVFGAVVRSIIIIIGLMAAVVTGLFGLVELLLWPLVPFLPLIGLGLVATGWTL